MNDAFQHPERADVDGRGPGCIANASKSASAPSPAGRRPVRTSTSLPSRSASSGRTSKALDPFPTMPDARASALVPAVDGDMAKPLSEADGCPTHQGATSASAPPVTAGKHDCPLSLLASAPHMNGADVRPAPSDACAADPRVLIPSWAASSFTPLSPSDDLSDPAAAGRSAGADTNTAAADPGIDSTDVSGATHEALAGAPDARK
mmetsp:Transcript_25928/g.97685  ORF Transcript_25928/g.97685 Transcript_25928/m.97685 type:complete len:206 (+) Transcript_25928:3121-3738(+)